MNHLDGVAFTIVIVSFLVVTCIGFAEARWRPAEDPLHLHEWGLGGRGLGTFVSWFLLGGDIYTAYAFIAVPALVYAAGRRGSTRCRTRSWCGRSCSSSGRACGRSPARAVTSARVSSSGGGTDPRDWGSRWRRPGSWPRCRTSRCSSSASSPC